MKNKKLIKDAIKVTIGGILLGFAYAKLMVPNEIISGGATSLSMIFAKLTNYSISFYTKVFTLGFLTLSFIFLGTKNVVLSILSSLMYTQSFAMFYNMNIHVQTHIVIDFILAGLLIGLGYFLSISAGASTVGVEVIALIAQKYYTDLHLAKAIRLLNILVLSFGYLVYGIKSILIGILFSIFYSKVLDGFLKLDKEREI